MTTPAKKRGFDGNVYRNTGSHVSPTYNQIESAQDIKIGDAWKTFDASSRASQVAKELPAQLDWSIEFSVIWDSTDVDLQALRSAYRNKTAIDLTFLDGDSGTSTSSGPQAEWLIKEMPYDAPLQDGMKVTFKCVPHGNCSFEPLYVTIA